MRFLILAFLVSGSLLFSADRGEAQSKPYPWCLTDSEGTVNCGFQTFNQCFASRSGNRDMCTENPRFKGKAPWGQQRPRRSLFSGFGN